MKVVLFCGGMGTRLREYSDRIPKPLVPVGGMPILWHIMKYYASYGHTDFILCLGYKGEQIRQFFLEYREAIAGDLAAGPDRVGTGMIGAEPKDWRITFVDTGSDTSIGGRLLKVRRHLVGERTFLANYADVLTDVDLDVMLSEFRASNAIASFCCVPPPYSFHMVSVGADNRVSAMTCVRDSGIWINGGYMILSNSIFSHLHSGEDLVVEGFLRLAEAGRLYAHRHAGFWMPMDTFKEKQALDDLVARGETPWQVWKMRGDDAKPKVA